MFTQVFSWSRNMECDWETSPPLQQRLIFANKVCSPHPKWKQEDKRLVITWRSYYSAVIGKGQKLYLIFLEPGDFYTLASRICPSVCWADHEVERFFFCATLFVFLFHFPKALSTYSPADISLLMIYFLFPSDRKGWPTKQINPN